MGRPREQGATTLRRTRRGWDWRRQRQPRGTVCAWRPPVPAALLVWGTASPPGTWAGTLRPVATRVRAARRGGEVEGVEVRVLRRRGPLARGGPSLCLREHPGLSFISPLTPHISRKKSFPIPKCSTEADFSIWALLLSSFGGNFCVNSPPLSKRTWGQSGEARGPLLGSWGASAGHTRAGAHLPGWELALLRGRGLGTPWPALQRSPCDSSRGSPRTSG